MRIAHGRIQIPTKATPLAAASTIALAISTLAPHAEALDYVDASPAGPEFPEWEGGDTELSFADIDADGHVDLLSIGDHGSPFINTDQHGIMVYFGAGAGGGGAGGGIGGLGAGGGIGGLGAGDRRAHENGGGWTIHMEGDFGYGGIAVGDVDNDGHLDVGYGMHHDYASGDFGDQLIEVALGDGTGRSWTPWDDGLATNGEDYGMFATDFADIDSDGDLDLASNSFGCCNGVHVYRNEGDGTWTQTWSSAGGNASPFLVFGDINGDGDPDLAAAHQMGAVWLGDGDGGFTPAETGLPPRGNGGYSSVALGDVDGDGFADLALVRGGGAFVYVWRDGQWESRSTGLPASGGYEMASLWDMDVDGHLDVVAARNGEVTIYAGDGLGTWTFTGGTLLGAASATHALEVGGDVDHNGLPDIAILRREGSWPNDHNVLYVVRESSVPAERSTAVIFPRGNETFPSGAVRTIRWASTHIGTEPAAIDLELSVSGPDGPWNPIALGIADSGHWQWTVTPASTATAHVRVTLRQDGEVVSSVGSAFRIEGDTAGAPTLGWGPTGASLRFLPNPSQGGARIVIAASRGGGLEIGVPGEAESGDGVRGDGGLGGLSSDGRPWSVVLHDAGGRLVRRLRVSGSPTLEWDGRDEDGRPVPSGLYLARLEVGDGRVIGKTARVAVTR